MPPLDQPHEHRSCPSCGSDITGFATGACPICVASSSELKPTAPRQSASTPPRPDPSLPNDGHHSLALLIMLSLLAPLAFVITIIPVGLMGLPAKASLPLATGALILYMVAILRMAARNALYHRMGRMLICLICAVITISLCAIWILANIIGGAMGWPA